jgi:hypothetical protein
LVPEEPFGDTPFGDVVPFVPVLLVPVPFVPLLLFDPLLPLELLLLGVPGTQLVSWEPTQAGAPFDCATAELTPVVTRAADTVAARKTDLYIVDSSRWSLISFDDLQRQAAIGLDVP